MSVVFLSKRSVVCQKSLVLYGVALLLASFFAKDWGLWHQRSKFPHPSKLQLTLGLALTRSEGLPGLVVRCHWRTCWPRAVHSSTKWSRTRSTRFARPREHLSTTCSLVVLIGHLFITKIVFKLVFETAVGGVVKLVNLFWRLRAPSELFDLLHGHYDRFKHESSGTGVEKKNVITVETLPGVPHEVLTMDYWVPGCFTRSELDRFRNKAMFKDILTTTTETCMVYFARATQEIALTWVGVPKNFW